MDADLRWALSTPWVAARLGVDPLRVERLRRAGELFAVRPAGCADWLYPSWQFDSTGRVRPAVASLLREAREQGIGSARVHELLTRRTGLVEGRRFLDVLLEGGEERVLAAVRLAAAA
jgi:hypothetical protein